MNQTKPDTLSIFGEALEKGSLQEVGDYLDDACGVDIARRARVEALLKARGDAGDFLGGPSSHNDATAASAIAEKPGEQIGPYKLLEEIGQGGFGIVYMAEQTKPIRRRVALKIIKPGMDTREVIARFEAERQALALMDHPNIAKVLDGGATNSGRPYFVMELVKGIPLTDFCDGNQISTRGRLELFATVCQAIQHAHQKGVIHRDIKPSNVMVTLHDGRPVPKVIDFGVAKAISQQLTEKTMFTSYGQMIGTPQYMSPEQAEMSGLDIDTRSDVYSLGVLLYELLTGSTPLEAKRLRGQMFVEMQRMIREDEPPRPSTRLSTQGKASASFAARQGTDSKKLTSLLRGELDWVVMKALEKDRVRRYETANGLAADIQRFLDNEPVVACPPSAAYRLRKLAQKYRSAFATAAVIAAAMLLATVVSTWQAVRANQEAARANLAGQRAEKEKAKADQNAAAAQLQTSRAHMEKQRAELQREQAEASRSAVRRHAYVSDMRLASQAHADGNLEYVIELLERHWPDPSSGEDVRGFEWYHWWQATRLEQQSTRSPRFGPLGRMAVAPDNGILAVTGWPFGFYVFETDQLRPLGSPRDDSGRPWFSPDGAYLFASSGNQIELLKSETLNLAKTINPPPNGGNEMLAFSSTQPLMAFAAEGPKARIVLWNMRSWESEADWDPPGAVRALAFSPDGKSIVTGMTDDTMIAWDVVTREVKRTVIQSAHFIISSPHRGLFAIASNNYVFLYDRELEPIGSPIETSSPVTALAFSADGNRLAAGTSADNRILVWDVTHQTPSLALAHTILGHSRSVQGVAFGSDNNTVWSSGDDGWLKQWNLSRCEPFQTLTHVPRASRVAYLDDGQSLLIIDEYGTVHRWQVAAHASLGPLNPENEYTGFAVSGNGSVFAGANRDGNLEVWDTRSSDLRIKRNPVPADVRRFAVAPNGATIAYSCDGGMDVKNLASGNTKHVPFTGGNPVLSADGRKLALHRWDTTQIWNIEADPPLYLAEVKGWGGEECSAFSPSGELLAVGSHGGQTRLHEADTGALKASLKGHTGPVRSVTFSHDGKSLVSGGDDQTVRIWDVESGQLLAILSGHTAAVTSVDFSPANDSLASCSADGTVKIWTAASESEVNQNVESRIKRARYYTTLRDWKKAAKILAEAQELAPDSPAILAMRGFLHGVQSQWESAISSYTQAIELSPNDGELYEQRGNMHVQHMQREKAISDYVKALLLSEELRNRVSFMRIRQSLSSLPLVPKGSAWRYTTDEPAQQWQAMDGFDDSHWRMGEAPFGWSEMSPRPGSRWGKLETDRIWMRHTFQMDHKTNAPLTVEAFVDDSAEIYLNGVQIQRIESWTGDRFRMFKCPPEAKLRNGKNVLAVHCRNAIDFGKIDVSLRVQDDEGAIDAILDQALAARPDIEDFQHRREEWQVERDRWAVAADSEDQTN